MVQVNAVSEYFNNEDSRFLFRSVSEKLHSEAVSEKEKVLAEALMMFANSPKVFDELCPYNIQTIGSYLKSYVEELKLGNKDQIDMCMATAYRFLAEASYRRPGQLMGVVKSIHEIRLSDFEYGSEAELIMRFADYRMPVELLTAITKSEEVRDIDSVLAHFKSFPKFKEETETMLQEYSTRAENLKVALERYETAYNFVGLYDGFDSLAKSKRWSARFSLGLLAALAFAMMAPLVFKIYTLISTEEYLQGQYEINVPFLVSIAGLELLLLYFYRVVLHNLKSVRGQLIQIDLRRTLCQFVNSYAKYVSENHAKDSGVLARFEQLIFSGIVTDTAQIPSSFDGIEQLGKIVEKIKPR